jgi:hypothetical protein
VSIKVINNRLKKVKGELYTKYKVINIGVFGSIVRGTSKKKSDIDIMVEYQQLPDLLKFIELENYLTGVLGKKVDLVEKTSIRKELKKYIMQEVLFV